MQLAETLIQKLEQLQTKKNRKTNLNGDQAKLFTAVVTITRV